MLEIVLSLFVTAIASCIFYYLACIHRDSYWKNRGIPGPKGDVIFGNLKSLINPDYPSALQLRDWAKQYGKFYGIREGWRHVLIISDPKLVHELLVTKFEYFHGRKSNPLVGNVDKEKRIHVFSARGLRWKRLRNISSPSFNVTNLKKIMGTVDDSVNVMMMHLKKISETGEPFNIHPYCHELTMDVICRIALGQKGTHQFENPYTDEAKKIFSSLGISWFHIFAYLFPWGSSVWLLKRISLLTAGIRKAPFKEIVDKLYKIVEERKKLREEGKNDHNGDKVDFIDLFLNAEVNEMPDQNADYKPKGQIKVSKTMTTDEIVAQCFVFLIAGFDTTANTLANTIFFLAKDPERQKILQDEIDELCPDENVTYEQLQSLKYEDAVMKEALRMVPIAAFAASRECAETTTLGEITIEKGTYVAVDVFSLHYDKEIWGNDADKFIPERFLDNENRHPGSWIPFGGGPRTCIGMRLAYLEEKLALVKILKEYDIVACAETEKVLKLVGAAILNPESVTIKLVKRK